MSAGAPAAPRVFAALLVARAAFGLVYLAVSVGRLPVFWYFPIEHRWELAGRPAGLAMGWYGTTAAALLAAAIAAGLVWIAAARGPIARALSRTAVVMAIAHAGALVLLVDYAYFGWTLSHQTPAPLDEPICPR